MIKFEISSQIVEVAPNNVTQVSLTVTNTSQIIDFFTVSIEPLISPETMGLYPGWVEFNTPTFSLRPSGDNGRGGDSTQAVIVKVNIPPQVYAGNYAGTILITARSGADNSVEIPFNIVISQIDAQTFEIQPIDSSSRKSAEVYRVVVSNQGNAPHIYSVYAEDPNDDLKFIIDPPEVPLRPGEQAALTLKAQPRQRNWAGDDINHEFKVKMEGSDQEIRGSFKQKAAIAPLHWLGRRWLRFVFFFALLLVLLAVAAIIWLPQLFKPPVSYACAPVSLRTVNVLSNGTNTNILVSGRNGALPYTSAVTLGSDKLPGIFGSLVSVSPDGRRIAYVTASDLAMNDARIWVKNLDTDQEAIASIPITTGLWPVAPVWSASGDKLAYVMRRVNPAAATVTATTSAATTPAIGVTGTVTATTAAATTAAATTASGTPGADVNNPSQLDLYVITKFDDPPPAKPLASPPNLVPNLFYGNNIATNPLCWASDDSGLLVSQQTNDGKVAQVALTDGKVNVVTPQAGGLSLPKATIPNIPSRPKDSGLIMPLKSLLGVPASFLQVPQAHLAAVQQQTGTGTSTPGATKGTTPAGTNNGTGTVQTNPANACSILKPFSQNDPRWADLPLRDGSTNTMAELGCPITGAAILLNYQNVETNPALLSSCLGNLTSPLNQAGWFAIAQQCGSFKLQGGVRADFSWDLLDASLQKGPTIVGLLGGPSGSHFLVVTGGSQGISTSYSVTDPWDGTTYKTLDYFLSKGYRPRWVISYEGDSAACVTSISDTTNQLGIRTSGAVDGGLYQQPQPFRFEVTGSNDTASATVRIVNPRLNLDDSSKTLQANETETFTTEGNYIIAIAVKDASGNTVLTRNVYFTIDRTAPVLGYRLTPTVDKTTNKSLVPVNVTLQATDDLSGISSIEYQVNSSQWQLYSSDTDRAPLTISDNGTYAINYRATDGAGNTAAAQTINFVIEKPVQTNTNNGARPTPGGGTQATPSVGPNGGTAGANGGGAKTSAAALTVPTVTAVPTATPRPVVKATVTPVPTTAPPTTQPPTPTIQPTSLLPTGSPEITPTATVPLPTTEVVITPTVTVALAPVMVVPITTLTFPPDNPKQQLTIQNTGNAQLVWTIATGNSNSLVSFSLTTGNVDVGGSVTVDVTLLNPNLTGNDQTTTFGISSNGGGSQNVGIIIKAQPLPVGSVALVPSTTVLSDTNTIQVNLTLPSSNITPNHIDLYATYKGCVDSCVAAPVQIGQSIPYTGNSLTAPWNTTNVVPQSGIILGGNICMNQDCSVYQQLNPLTGLSIDMSAAITLNPPVTDNSLALTTTLNITNRSARTKQVNISILVDDVVVRQFTTNDAVGWSVDWDTSQIAPSSKVVIAGKACDSTDTNAVCLDIPSLTGYHTTVGGTVTSTPDLTVAKSLTGTISFVVTPTNNVKSVVVNGFYAKSATSVQEVQQAGVATTKDTNNTTFTVNVDTTPWPIQTGITLTVSACFNQDGTDCTPLAPNPFGNLYIPAGAPANISDNTAEPKYTTVNTNYPTPLSVRITDSKNNPVNGATVLFLVDAKTDPAQSAGYTGASASFAQTIATYGQFGATAVTDQNGIATVISSNTLKANTVEGNFVIKVLISGMTDSPTTFIALNNSPVGAKQMTVTQTTDNQTAKIGEKFNNNLQVKLESGGITVTFTTQNTGLGAHFGNDVTASSTFTVTTDASGFATAGDLTANISAAIDKTKLPLVGSYKVRASAPGYTPVLFTLSNYAGDPKTIKVVTASSPGVYDSPVDSVTYTQTIKSAYPNIAALVLDAGGNPLSNVGVVFTSTIAPQPGVTFSNSAGTNATIQTGTSAAVQGVAVATGLNANARIGRFTVRASVVNTPNVATSGFIFINTPGAPSKVTISTPLTSTVKANQALDSTLQATVYDDGDNPVNNLYNGNPVQVQFNSPAFTDRTLNGGSSVTFSDTTTTVYTATVSGGGGVAQINVPVIGTCKIGGPFQLTATLVLNGAAVNNATSSTNLSIVQGDPNSFVQHYNGDGNSQFITITNAAALPFKAKMLDTCSNVLTNSNVVFTAPQVSGPTGNFSTYASGNYSATVSTGASGEATAPAFYANLKASYSSYVVTATAASKPSVSQSFNVHNNPGLPASIVPGGIGSDSTQPLHLTVGSNPTASQVVTATVLDQGGNPVFLPTNQTLSDNTKVIFVGNGAAQNVAGANFDSVNNFAYTDANGVITSTTSLTTTNKASTTPYQITAHSAVNNNVQAQFFLVNDPDMPSKITVDGLDPASKLFAQSVNIKCDNNCDNVPIRTFNPITVLVTDKFDNPISNNSINFTVNPGTPLSGSAKPTANFGTRPTSSDTQNTSYITSTNASGQINLSDPAAADSILYPGFYAGDYNIHVTSAPVNGNTSLDTFINFENLPDQIPQAVSIQITSSGNSNPVSAPVTTTVNTSFPELSALVKDANGNGINGKVVTFTVSPPPTSTNVATGIWVNDTTTDNFSTNTQTKNTVPGYATINRNILQPDTPVGANTDLQANQKVGSFTLTALVVGANDAPITQIITLTNIPQNFVGAQAQLTLIQPASSTAQVDKNFAGFTAHLVDQFGNPIPLYPVTFMVPLSTTTPVTSTTGYFNSSDNGDGTSKTVTTDTSGNATIGGTALRAGIKVGSFNVSAKVPTAPLSTTYLTSTNLINLTNLAGDPDTNHITTSVGSTPQPVKVGDVYNNPITVTVRDKYDNPVPSALVSYTITSGTNSANVTVMDPAQNTNQTTNSAGQTVINSVETNTNAGTFSAAIHAKGPTATGSVNGAFPIQFVNIPDFPNKIYVVSGNNQTPDVGQPFTQTLTISVTDQYNNPVGTNNPNNQPNQVVFTAPPDVPNGGPTAILTDPVAGAGTTYTATVGAGGFAVLPNTNIRANSQLDQAGYNVTLSVPGVNSTTLGHLDSFHFTNVADLTLVTTTTQIKQAGGEGFAPLQVKVGGAGGAGVPNLTVSFSITNTNLGVFSSGTCQQLNTGNENGSVITFTATTGSDGVASVSNFCAGTQLGGYRVKASSTFGNVTQTVWIPLANTATLGVATNDNQSVLSNGGVFSDLGVNVTGFGGANIPGANVTFAVTSTNYAVITPVQPSTTNSGGLATASVTAGSFVGNYRPTAVLVTPSGNFTYTFSLTNTVKVNLAASSQTILAGSNANNGQPQVITGTVVDAQNQGVNNVTVTFASTDTTKGTITNPTSPISASGQATVTVKAGTKLGIFNVTATPYVGGVPVGDAATTPATLQMTTSANLTGSTPTNPLAGQQNVPITVTVRGFNNVALNNIPVAFSISPASPALATIVSTPVSSTVSGVVTATLNTAPIAGPYNLIATLDPAQFNPGPAPTVTATIPLVNMVNLSYSAPNTQLLAGGVSSDNTAIDGATSQVTFNAKGASSANVSGVQIRLTSDTPARGAFVGAVGGVVTTAATTDASGLISPTLQAGNQVGGYTLSAIGMVGNTQVTSGVPITFTALTNGVLQANTLTNLIQAGGATQPISVTLQGNTDTGSGKTALISGATIMYSTDVTGTTLSTLSSSQNSTTDFFGVASLNVTTTARSGYFTVTANLVLPNNQIILQTPPHQDLTVVNTATLATSAGITTLASDSSVPITATVTGFNNSQIVGAAVVFSGTTGSSTYADFNGSSGPVSSTITNTNSSGIANATFRSKAVAGTYNLQAQLNPTQYGGFWNPAAPTAIPVTNTVTFALFPQTTTNLLAASSNVSNDGQSTPVTATVRGATGQAVDGVIINYTVSDTTKGNLSTLQKVSGAGLISYTNVLTASNGLGTYSVSAQVVASNNTSLDIGGGSKTFTATTSATFSANSGQASPSNPLAGGTSVPISYTVLGYNNHLVQGATVAITTNNTTRASITTASDSTDTSGVANLGFSTGDQAGPYTITGSLVDNPTTLSKTTSYTNTVTIVSDNAAQPLAGGGSDSMVITAKGNGTKQISGVDLSFTAPSSGTSGSVTGGPYTTGSDGTVSIPVTSTATYGVWNLGVTPKVGGGNVGNTTSYNVPVTNTLLVTTTATTTSNPPRPLANGGTAPMSVQVYGFNNYKPGSGVTVAFGATDVSGGCSGGCGSVTTSASTNGSGIATATVTATTSTAITTTVAQSYNITATVNVGGVANSLPTPVLAINTVGLTVTAGGNNPTTNKIVKVVDNDGNGLAGFTVQFTVVNSGGTTGSTSSDGYLCNTDCTITSTLKYLGAQIRSASDGTAGVNITQAVQAVSPDGTTYQATGPEGANGINLLQSGPKNNGTQAADFGIEATVLLAYLPTGESGPTKVIALKPN